MRLRTSFVFLVLAAAALVRTAPLAAEDAPVAVRFLTVKEAQAAIVDESMEPYFSILQPLEMAAKTGAALEGKDLAAQRDECRKRYQAAAREFTDDEKAAITEAARGVGAALKTAYPMFANTPWSFLKLDGSIEGGMPHTRGPHIVLPGSWPGRFAQMKARKADLVKSALAEVLVHEQCHVLQRAKPDVFADLYTKVWGLVHAKEVEDCPAVLRTRVVNPDGPDMRWIFAAKDGAATAYWQPMILMPADVAVPRMPADFRVVAIALDKKGDAFAQRTDKDGAPVTTPLEQVAAYQAEFGAVGENFHPNETFACLFSWMASKDQLSGPSSRRPGADFTKLREWCRQHLK